MSFCNSVHSSVSNHTTTENGALTNISTTDAQEITNVNPSWYRVNTYSIETNSNSHSNYIILSVMVSSYTKVGVTNDLRGNQQN